MHGATPASGRPLGAKPRGGAHGGFRNLPSICGEMLTHVKGGVNHLHTAHDAATSKSTAAEHQISYPTVAIIDGQYQSVEHLCRCHVASRRALPPRRHTGEPDAGIAARHLDDGLTTPELPLARPLRWRRAPGGPSLTVPTNPARAASGSRSAIPPESPCSGSAVRYGIDECQAARAGDDPP
jgi:hypothetical protein